MAPLIFIIVIKVRGDSDSTFAELSMEYHNFPVAQQGAEIFEFKVDPVPKLTFWLRKEPKKCKCCLSVCLWVCLHYAL